MRIDWKLLANQKATLLDIINNGLITEAQKAHLDGIIGLIDETQDNAAERGVAGVVYLHEDGYRDADAKLVGPSEWVSGPNWRQMVCDVVNSEYDTGCDNGLTVIDKYAFDKLDAAFGEVPQ